MIDVQKDVFVIQCDECLEEVLDGRIGLDFCTTIARAKRLGWKITPIGKNEWSHTCPNCAA